MDRPIPAFYCCYLLRSTVRHQNLYVGSTPNPVRRLRQHNGIAKGGAVRTSRDSLRPWEMSCLVVGFPSKIAALQFEWAWQNTHLTRHIAPDERITQAQTRTRYSPKTGKTRKKVGRPRMSLTDKLANLHILLRAKSFERWPLEVRFFAEDVFKMWKRVQAKFTETIRPGIGVGLDSSTLSAGDANQENDSLDPTCVQIPSGIHALEVTYQSMKAGLEKSQSIFSTTGNVCSICRSIIKPKTSLALVCPTKQCQATFHLPCLSERFLGAAPQSNAVLPTTGACPSCKETLGWSELVRNLSLRIRGEKEVAALFKERRRKKAGPATADATSSTVLYEATRDDEHDLDQESDDEVDDSGFKVVSSFTIAHQPESSQDDGWKCIDDAAFDLADVVSPPPGASPLMKTKSSKSVATVEVIEDSDWDSAEVID